MSVIQSSSSSNIKPIEVNDIFLTVQNLFSENERKFPSLDVLRDAWNESCDEESEEEIEEEETDDESDVFVNVSIQEPKEPGKLGKTMPCKYLLKDGKNNCSNRSCTFFHSKQEQNFVPCKHEHQYGYCRKPTCTFKHTWETQDEFNSKKFKYYAFTEQTHFKKSNYDPTMKKTKDETDYDAPFCFSCSNEMVEGYLKIAQYLGYTNIEITII